MMLLSPRQKSEEEESGPPAFSIPPLLYAERKQFVLTDMTTSRAM